MKKAISVNGDLVMFLDADIKNLFPEWIDKLVIAPDDFLIEIGKRAADSKWLSPIEP